MGNRPMERHRTIAGPRFENTQTAARSDLDRDLEHFIPAPLISLIGREQEIDSAIKMFKRDDIRLVTFIGPGGVGKTQLALAVARHLTGDFSDGVVFVSLAPISDHAHVASAIAETFDIRETGARSLRDSLCIAL